MNDGTMHETIRSLYQGVFETGAWQRSLVALCGASGSSQASLIVRNRALDRVVVTHAVDYKADAMEAYTSHYYQFDPSRPFADRLGVGDWYIDHRDVGEQVIRASPFYGEFLHGLNVASVMSCLIERHPTYEIYPDAATAARCQFLCRGGRPGAGLGDSAPARCHRPARAHAGARPRGGGCRKTC